MSREHFELTPRQRDVLLAVGRAGRGGITTSALSNELNMQRQNIRKYLLTLRDFGLVKYEPTERQSAIIYLTERGQAHIPESSGENISLPLLGEVAAGKPIEVV